MASPEGTEIYCSYCTKSEANGNHNLHSKGPLRGSSAAFLNRWVVKDFERVVEDIKRALG